MHIPVPARGALVSLTAFGADDVGRRGTPWSAPLARASAAAGSELRGGLLAAAADGGPAGRAARASASGLARVYSSPHGMWDGTGRRDEAAVREGLDRAIRLG